MNNIDDKKRAVILLSGGLDSATVLATATNDGFELYALSFNYGQRNRFEQERASHIAKAFNVREHRLLTLDMRAFGGSALTSDIPLHKDRTSNEIASSGIPPTYVPCRNTIFLAYALAWAEVLEANDIFIGVNAVDYSGYPDCRPEYIAAFEQMANLATKMSIEHKRKVSVHTPLIHLSKSQIILLGLSLGVDYSLTISCYDPSAEGISCGRCDACLIRQRAFHQLGKIDPLPYVSPLRHHP